MSVPIACLLIATMPSLAAPPVDAPAEKDLAALQGSWTVVSLETEGKTRDFPENPPRWIIKGNKVRYGGAELAELTVDATTTPRSIDLTFRKPKRVLEGIYAIEGDTLKVCVNRQTDGVKERPNGFATKDKSEWRLLVFKRDKAARGNEIEGLGGFVGLAIQAFPDRKELVIATVLDGSPAEKAGLKKDDLLVRVGGQEATDLQAVIGMVRQAKPGSELPFRIKRGGKEHDISVKVGVVPFFLLD